jgi:hypothetical protein
MFEYHPRISGLHAEPFEISQPVFFKKYSSTVDCGFGL